MSVLQRSQSVAHRSRHSPARRPYRRADRQCPARRRFAEPTIAAIEAALSKYKVIFFRDQGHLDDAGQERFAARFGDLVAHPTSPAKAGSAAILEIDLAAVAPTAGTPT